MIIYGSPFRYYQGFGIITKLGELLEPLGGNFFVVGDQVVKGLLGDKVEQALKDGNKKYIWDNDFSGECTGNEIERMQKIYRENKCDAILAWAAVKAWMWPKA